MNYIIIIHYIKYITYIIYIIIYEKRKNNDNHLEPSFLPRFPNGIDLGAKWGAGKQKKSCLGQVQTVNYIIWFSETEALNLPKFSMMH